MEGDTVGWHPTTILKITMHPFAFFILSNKSSLKVCSFGNDIPRLILGHFDHWSRPEIAAVDVGKKYKTDRDEKRFRKRDVRHARRVATSAGSRERASGCVSGYPSPRRRPTRPYPVRPSSRPSFPRELAAVRYLPTAMHVTYGGAQYRPRQKRVSNYSRDRGRGRAGSE